jgi:hypothetical protein
MSQKTTARPAEPDRAADWQRFEQTVKRMLDTPHKLHKPSKEAKRPKKKTG